MYKNVDNACSVVICFIVKFSYGQWRMSETEFYTIFPRFTFR